MLSIGRNNLERSVQVALSRLRGCSPGVRAGLSCVCFSVK